MNNLKNGLGLNETFFSSASFTMNLTVTPRICQKAIYRFRPP
jgi:hypothetical protein